MRTTEQNSDNRISTPTSKLVDRLDELHDEYAIARGKYEHSSRHGKDNRIAFAEMQLIYAERRVIETELYTRRLEKRSARQ